MLPNPRLAGRYAKSLIDLAVEKNQLDTIYNDMLVLQAAIKGSREFANLLKSPIIKADKKGKILDAITAGKISTITATFNTLLLHKGRESYLPEIVTAFIEQYKAYKHIYTVKLTTAMAIGDDVKNEIVSKVKAGQALQNIELDAQVDEALIGGFVLEVGDQLVDASVAFDLHNIRKQFENNDFIYKIR